MRNRTFREEENIFGEMLRLRIECQLKSAAIANGIGPLAIGSHSLRAGGATALYVKGISITLIQRFGGVEIRFFSQIFVVWFAGFRAFNDDYIVCVGFVKPT